MTRLAALLVVSCAALSACSGSSDFARLVTAHCEATPMKDQADCACAVTEMDKTLDPKAKAVLIALAKAKLEGKDQETYLPEAGVTADAAETIIDAATPAMDAAMQKCAKPK